MARFVPLSPFDRELFGGASGIAVPARNLFDLVRRLEATAPGFADAVETRGMFAVDGVHSADWSAPLAADAEVLLLPRIAGGR